MIKYVFYKKDGFYYVYKKYLFKKLLIICTRDYRSAKRIFESCQRGDQSKHSAFTYCQDESITKIYKSCFNTIEIRSL